MEENTQQLEQQQKSNQDNFEFQFNYIKKLEKQYIENPSYGEQQLVNFKEANPRHKLPEALKIRQVIKYDTNKYDFGKMVEEILSKEVDLKERKMPTFKEKQQQKKQSKQSEQVQENDKNNINVEKNEEEKTNKIEDFSKFQPNLNVINNYGYNKWLRSQLSQSQIVEDIYVKFIREVIGPHVIGHLKQQILDQENLKLQEKIKSMQEQNKEEELIQKIKFNEQCKIQKKLSKSYKLLFQFPPTLRVHPSTNPPLPLGKVHRDAEFGHQPGEVNFWLPITKAEGGGSLWCESEPMKGDFKPFQLEYGEVQRFWGAMCRHISGINDTGKTRISLDFRVAPKSTYDQEWTLPNIHVHDWREMNLELTE